MKHHIWLLKAPKRKEENKISYNIRKGPWKGTFVYCIIINKLYHKRTFSFHWPSNPYYACQAVNSNSPWSCDRHHTERHKKPPPQNRKSKTTINDSYNPCSKASSLRNNTFQVHFHSFLLNFSLIGQTFRMPLGLHSLIMYVAVNWPFFIIVDFFI